MSALKFLSMRDLRMSTTQIKKMLMDDGTIIVTNNGKPAALMLEINESTLESVLTDLRKMRAKRAVTELQRAAKENGTSEMTMDEIDAEIADTRKERRKKA